MPNDNDIELAVKIAEMQKDNAYIRITLDTLHVDYEKRLRSLESSDRRWALVAVIVSAFLTVAFKFLFP